MSVPILNMSCVLALQVLHEQAQNDNSSCSKLFHFKQKYHPSWSHLDWDSAIAWAQLIGIEKRTLKLDDLAKSCCQKFIASNPTLIKLAANGRESFLGILSEDEKQVFRVAGLSQNNLALENILWWDKFKLEKRTELDELKLLQGRMAEQWTMEHEQSVLRGWGIVQQPYWASLDADYYGYDIRSYRRAADGSLCTLLIEVKSFAEPATPIIYVTRNEWERAVQASPNYSFFVWCIRDKAKMILSASELLLHIPIETDIAHWTTLRVDVSYWWKNSTN
ncbi:MAG TPA: DUF3883 domain-containing protein [Puia sp.]|uniref:DUF3883 domain-containing protein n=1 Tax=Puia sp. TaxID=2045100 RepID=UPI002B948CFE|nr:DUF3883 domain-containing protein [Puia sp.]HVU95300.1 DUF3883 domain-containing protein [Puia sp.]